MKDNIKVGDLVLIKAEITKIDNEEEYQYDVSIHCGKDIWVDDYAVSNDAIIGRYDNDNTKEKQIVIAESTERETIVTADLYRETLNNIQKMLYTDILQMMGWLEYEAPLNREGCITRIIENYTPKGVVDTYEEFKHNNTVNVGDVIYLESDKKEYIVTQIENGRYSLIRQDGYTTSVAYQNHLNTIPRNAYKKIKSGVDLKSYLFG